MVHNILYNMSLISLVPHFTPSYPSNVDFKSTDMYSMTTKRHFIYAISFKAFSGIRISYKRGVYVLSLMVLSYLIILISLKIYFMYCRLSNPHSILFTATIVLDYLFIAFTTYPPDPWPITSTIL